MGLTLAECLRILNISSPQAAKDAFKALVKVHHPDMITARLNRAATAIETEKFRKMVEARDALSKGIFTSSYESFSSQRPPQKPPTPPKPPKQETPKQRPFNYGRWEQAAYGAYAKQRIKQDWEYETFGNEWEPDFEKRESRPKDKTNNDKKYHRKNKKANPYF